MSQHQPPDGFCVGLVIGPAGGARGTYLKEMFEYKVVAKVF